MKFDIPENCHIRWQAALAVLEDLQEDKKAPFSMENWGRPDWENPECGTAGCFGGYIVVAPYCMALGAPGHGVSAKRWLLNFNNLVGHQDMRLYREIFHNDLWQGSRAKTLAFLKARLKRIFRTSTGKVLKAPLTFYVD